MILRFLRKVNLGNKKVENRWWKLQNEGTDFVFCREDLTAEAAADVDSKTSELDQKRVDSIQFNSNQLIW
jgi:hypothetical protein